MSSHFEYQQGDQYHTPTSIIPLRPKLCLDLEGGVLISEHEEILLTAREMSVLRILVHAMHNSRAYISAATLAQQIVPLEAYNPEHSIEQTISTIRRKLGEVPHHPHILRGRRGLGYRVFPEVLPS